MYNLRESLVSLLVSDLDFDNPPAYASVLTPSGSTRRFWAINWGAALGTLFYRLKDPTTSAVTEEAPSSWGNSFLLAAILGCDFQEAPLLYRRVRAFRDYILGPPHTANRLVWDTYQTVPLKQERRFQAIRRHVFLWFQRDPDALSRLIRKFEATFPEVVASHLRFQTDTPDQVTVIDPMMLVKLERDHRTVPVFKPVEFLTITEQEEIYGIQHMERLGVVSKFRASSLHDNYLFIKLSSYVSNVWDLQETIPPLNFADVDASRPIPPDRLLICIDAAKSWISQHFSEAGTLAKSRVLNALSLDDAPDHLVVYRRPKMAPKRPKETGNKKAGPTTRLYTVNVPERFTAVGVQSQVRVVLYHDQVWLRLDDLGLELELRKAWMSGGLSEAQFETQLKHFMNKTFMLSEGALQCFQPEFREQFFELFCGTKSDWLRRNATKRSLEKRSNGQRVRYAEPFTPEEDELIRTIAQPFVHRRDFDAVLSQMPHHASYRVKLRSKLFLALSRKKFDFKRPIDRILVARLLGESALNRFSSAI